MVARANADSIRDLIQFLDPMSASARITARLLASEPELMHQDKVLEHMFVHLENHPNIGSFFLALKNGAIRLTYLVLSNQFHLETLAPVVNSFCHPATNSVGV